MIATNLWFRTDGTGYWSTKQTTVHITGLELNVYEEDGEFIAAELRLFFDPATWDTATDGLIHTDPEFLKEVLQHFEEQGIPCKGWLGYSEMGMQGDDYVSMDASESFANDFQAWETALEVNHAGN